MFSAMPASVWDVVEQKPLPTANCSLPNRIFPRLLFPWPDLPMIRIVCIWSSSIAPAGGFWAGASPRRVSAVVSAAPRDRGVQSGSTFRVVSVASPTVLFSQVRSDSVGVSVLPGVPCNRVCWGCLPSEASDVSPSVLSPAVRSESTAKANLGSLIGVFLSTVESGCFSVVDFELPLGVLCPGVRPGCTTIVDFAVFSSVLFSGVYA